MDINLLLENAKQRERDRRARERKPKTEVEAEVENTIPQLNPNSLLPKQLSYTALGSLKFAKRKRSTNNNNKSTSVDSLKYPKPKNIDITRRSSIPAVELQSENDNSSRQYAPPRKRPRGKSKAVYESSEVVDTRLTIRSSDWYNNIDMKAKASRGDVQNVQHVLTLIENCIALVRQSSEKTASAMSNLRSRLHEMEFYNFLSPVIIKRSKVLENKGLPRIFDKSLDSIDFPWDIRADAEALYIRWVAGDFDMDLLRGISTKKSKTSDGKSRTSHSLDPAWPYKKSANASGSNNLFNGQWWPLRICALRDGAHGEQEAGIHGQVGFGAYSVVVGDGGYADKDNGEMIEYCGTASTNDEPTRNTKLMLESWRKENSIRVFRSENAKSKYAPKEGIRYDGLYKIRSPSVELMRPIEELLHPKTAMYRFNLIRQENQDPLRFEGDESRPSAKERGERAKIRNILAGSSR